MSERNSTKALTCITDDKALDEVKEEPSAPALTPGQKNAAHLQFVALCWTLFIAGWGDASTGPLLPRIRQVYNVGFAIVSLIFVFACVGFVAGALANMYLTGRFGLGKILVFGCLCQVVAFAIQAAAPPFPVFVMAYAINGMGLALQDAQANAFIATMKNNSATKMGILHSIYSLGAFLSPFVATQFAQLTRWSFHYLVTMGMAFSSAVLLTCIFKFKTQDECLAQAGEVIPEKVEGVEEATFKEVMTTRAVHLLAIFIFVSVGVGVTIAGWTVTYILDVRGGGPSAGYISSGFFGGVTLGRVALLSVNKKVGEYRVMFIYGTISTSLLFTVWFIPSLIGNAIALSFVGFFSGPMYPIVMNQAGRVLPRRILSGSIGWIAGFGQAGSAVLPFLTGAIASKHGIGSMLPFSVAMMIFTLVLWALVPNKARVVK
ncbi:MFS general substrate transporter [Crassisporium funariophilum]|nr:MFS general substrate transporter [Crassisporium funariophilum]